MLANFFLRAYAIIAPGSSPGLGDLVLNLRGVPPGDLVTHFSLILLKPSSTFTMLGLSPDCAICLWGLGTDTGVWKVGVLYAGVDGCGNIRCVNQTGISGGGEGMSFL